MRRQRDVAEQRIDDAALRRILALALPGLATREFGGARRQTQLVAGFCHGRRNGRPGARPVRRAGGGEERRQERPEKKRDTHGRTSSYDDRDGCERLSGRVVAAVERRWIPGGGRRGTTGERR